jgi:hypothetical protein
VVEGLRHKFNDKFPPAYLSGIRQSNDFSEVSAKFAAFKTAANDIEGLFTAIKKKHVAVHEQTNIRSSR